MTVSVLEESCSFDPLPTCNIESSHSSDSAPRKVRSLSDIYQSCDCALFSMEPTCYDDAVIKKEWSNAMKEEIEAIEKNNTWCLVDLPPNKEAIGLKWIYKSKFNSDDGSLQRHKARLVAKGYAQLRRGFLKSTAAGIIEVELWLANTWGGRLISIKCIDTDVVSLHWKKISATTYRPWRLVPPCYIQFSRFHTHCGL